jgi:hypothetical protein
MPNSRAIWHGIFALRLTTHNPHETAWVACPGSGEGLSHSAGKPIYPLCKHHRFNPNRLSAVRVSK